MQTDSTNINPALALALSKLAPELDRDDLAPGELTGSAVVRIDWNLRVGEDYSQVINHTIPWPALLALALSKLNGATMESLVREFVEQGALDGASDKAIKAEATAALRKIKGAMPPRKCRGKVTGEASVVEVLS